MSAHRRPGRGPVRIITGLTLLSALNYRERRISMDMIRFFEFLEKIAIGVLLATGIWFLIVLVF